MKKRLAALVALLLLVTSSAAQAEQPNIVFFFADDLGWKDPGFMGSDYHLTPNLDRIAGQGMRFDQAYANAPNCAPSRAAMLSGMYAPRTGVYTVHPPTRGKTQHRKLIPASNHKFLEPEVVTLAEALKAAGYVTCTAGKYHVGDIDTASDPENQGFDYNIGGFSKGHPASYFSPYKNPRLEDGPKGEYLTDRLTDEVNAFIKANHEKPFFVYFTYYTVHTPMQPRKDLEQAAEQRPKGELHNRADYAGMMAALDESVGRVLKTLDELGLSENTIIIFSSDNGGNMKVTKQDPLRGGKGMPWEGGSRVPLTVSWPGHIEPGTVRQDPVLLFDLYPTLIEAVGGELPTSQPVDGQSLLPLLTGEVQALEERPLYWHFPAYLQGYGGEMTRWRATPYSTIRKGDWKLTEFFETNHVELYNLSEDISETTDLAAEKPEIVEQLHAELKAWRQETNAPDQFELNPQYTSP